MPIDISRVLGAPLGPIEYDYTEKDVILYALGIGFGAKPLDPSHLRYTYENGLVAFPTFGVIPPSGGMAQFLGLPGLDINMMMLLHGEQRLEMHGPPIPPAGRLVTRGKVEAIYDKGKGALTVFRLTTSDAQNRPIFSNVVSFFIRGEGGFGGESGPPVGNFSPDRAPDQVVEYPTLPQQALIYRLSGDRNPLHVDPAFAAMGGFDRPILHGLCSFGHVGRAVVEAFGGDDPARLGSLEVRFAKPVFPGETIATHLWDAGGGKVLLKAVAKERGVEVITNGLATLKS